MCYSFGSLSNVGVRGEVEEDSGSEGIEVSEAKGQSLQDLDGVVAALSKPVGQMKVESVQDIRFPVYEHFAAGFELGEIEPVAGVEPAIQQPGSGDAIRGIHEIIEGFFQSVGLQEPVGEAKHDVRGGSVLV